MRASFSFLSQLGNSLKLKFNPEFDYLVQLVFVQRFPSLLLPKLVPTQRRFTPPLASNLGQKPRFIPARVPCFGPEGLRLAHRQRILAP